MEHRLIAFLDALGVKGIWKTRDSSEVVKDWEKNVKDFHELKDEIKKEYHIEFDEPPQVKVFSDTVVLICKGRDPYDILGLMSLQVAYGICSSMFRGFFFRGTISYDEIENSEIMIIGPAIDEAASFNTKIDWMGISLAPSAANLLDQSHNANRTTGWFTKYNIPLKGQKPEAGWALNWPRVLPSIFTDKKSKSDPRQAMLDAFAKFAFGNSDQAKCTNTLAFYDSMISK